MIKEQLKRLYKKAYQNYVKPYRNRFNKRRFNNIMESIFAQTDNLQARIFSLGDKRCMIGELGKKEKRLTKHAKEHPNDYVAQGVLIFTERLREELTEAQSVEEATETVLEAVEEIADAVAL